MNGLGVMKLQPNLAVVHYCVVDGVGLVHCGIFFFKVISQPSEPNQSLAAGSLPVKRRIRKNRTWRKRHEVKAAAARSRNDRIGIAIQPLLVAQIWGRR